jgi:hypothetical protein
MLRLEPLEVRSLLSSLPLGGFPAGGFRADRLDGPPPWDVAVVVDGDSLLARAYAESIESFSDAAAVELRAGQPSWIAGIIGDTLLSGPDAAANDVDWYRLDLAEHDRCAVAIDAFAQRFGSGLDPAVSVFDEEGIFIASNDDYDIAGSSPQDAALRLGLDRGVYFVAVSSGGNLPDAEGGFEPLVPGSGHASRGSTGQYLLRVSAEPDSVRPQVIALGFEPDQTFYDAPGRLTVRFSEAMDLDGLVQGAELRHASGDPVALAAVSYDAITNEVTYLLLDRPQNGSYQFVLHSALVTDLADNALDGGASGDFVVGFRVDASAPEHECGEYNGHRSTLVRLGTLFPNELREGVRVTGLPTGDCENADHAYYWFRLPMESRYVFRVGAIDSSQDYELRLFDASYRLIAQALPVPGSGTSLHRALEAGDYGVALAAAAEGQPTGAYELVVQAWWPDIPALHDPDPGPAIQVVLRAETGGSGTVVVGPEQPDEQGTQSSEWLRGAVDALPAVSSEPVGKPQRESADSALAFADGATGLPAGFTLGNKSASAAFSVASVSGSFHDPLPDAVPHGTHALSLSPSLIRELAELTRSSSTEWSGASGGSMAATAFGSDSESPFTGAPDDQESPVIRVATSPAPLTLGVVASLGVASSLTVPSRRRTSTWAQRLAQLLGLGQA